MARKKDDSMSAVTAPRPAQIDLFELVDPRLSNTIELYDALPKYNWAPKREFHDLQEAEMTRTTMLRGQTYKVVIKPAILKKRGKAVLIYPSTREEVVEDALRKFATNGQGHMLEENAGVSFTLSQLRTELTTMGHTYNLAEIKEAITVCRGATLECYGDNGQTLISSSFFPLIALTTRGQYVDSKDARCFVAFNPMVTKSIMNLTFRQYNYELGMEIPSPLARFIYKRMSHYWVQASAMTPYTPKLKSFLQQSPRGVSEDMYSNTRAMNNALNLLIKHKVIARYDQNVEKKGRKVDDIQYTIYPHDEFIKMTKAANHHANEVRDRSGARQALDGMKKRRLSK